MPELFSKYFLPEEKVPVSPLKSALPQMPRGVHAGPDAPSGAGCRDARGRGSRTPVVEQTRTMRQFRRTGTLTSWPRRWHPCVRDSGEAPPAAEATPVAAVEEANRSRLSSPFRWRRPTPVVQEEVRTAPRQRRHRPRLRALRAEENRRKTGPSDWRGFSFPTFCGTTARDATLRCATELSMTSLGEEIKKSWELLQRKGRPRGRAHSTNYFKEALNEILANGQQVF